MYGITDGLIKFCGFCIVVALIAIPYWIFEFVMFLINNVEVNIK
jgi:hypothetical protein